MTGIFDFVLWVIPLSVELDFAGVVEDVLKETITKNTNKNFRAWFDRVRWGCEVVPVEEIYMNFDIDDLEHFYSDFHDLDHAHHHRVWSGKAIRILDQFNSLFVGNCDSLEMSPFIWEKDFRTLRKYVPSVMEYIARFYNTDSTGISKGIYRLKEDGD